MRAWETSMAERATVDRIDIAREPSGIRDTAGQDTVIERSKARKLRPWLIGGAVVIALAFFTIPALTQ